MREPPRGLPPPPRLSLSVREWRATSSPAPNARSFVKTGLGDRVANIFVAAMGKSTLGLSYGLVAAETLIAPAMPSTTARAGGVFLPIISSLSKQAGSLPGATARKLGTFLIQAQLQCGAHSSAMFMTAAAQNLLSLKLAAEVTGVPLSNPWCVPLAPRPSPLAPPASRLAGESPCSPARALVGPASTLFAAGRVTRRITWFVAAVVPALVSLIVTPFLVYKLAPPEIKARARAAAEAPPPAPLWRA